MKDLPLGVSFTQAKWFRICVKVLPFLMRLYFRRRNCFNMVVVKSHRNGLFFSQSKEAFDGSLLV